MPEYPDKELLFLVAELKESLKNLNNSLHEIKEENKELRKEISEIRAQINRWRGALPVFIAVGGLIGFALTFIEKLKGILF